MWSLRTRLLVSASAVLAAFLGLTGIALDNAFRESALSAARDRLQSQVYLLLSAAEMSAEGGLELPERLPEGRFSSPASDLYGEIVDAEGELVWRSPSSLAAGVPYPAAGGPGEGRFERIEAGVGALFALSFAVEWETAQGELRRYALRVAESTAGFEAQVARFRRSLLAWFLGAAAVLLLLQAIILHWGLRPLRRVARELSEIEAGEKDELGGRYPRELELLTANLNALLAHGRERLLRYRNALADLAHSLKTPLAVLRAVGEADTPGDELKATLQEQTQRMDRVVDYHLSRATASGRAPLGGRAEVEPVASRLARSLEKVYAQKSLAFTLSVNDGAVFVGDEGDLTEMLGNLMDNACKWAESRVVVSAAREGGALVLCVEDDGPGIAPAEERRILARGVKSSAAVEGHGIGLAIVREIVEELYAGELRIERSRLGGARIVLSL